MANRRNKAERRKKRRSAGEKSKRHKGRLKYPGHPYAW